MFTDGRAPGQPIAGRGLAKDLTLNTTTQQYIETCQHCGKQTGVTGELEPTQEWRCGQCSQRMIGDTKPENCVSCDAEPQYIEHAGPFDLAAEDSQLASGVCSACAQKIQDHTLEVQAGGVWFRCDCGAEGIIKHDHPVAQAVRVAAGVEPPDPCTLQLSECQGCSDATQNVDGQPSG